MHKGYEEEKGGNFDQNSDPDEIGKRLDLDDLGGEVCLLDWGDHETMGPPSCASGSVKLTSDVVLGGSATVTLCQESLVAHAFEHRLVAMEDNELVLPLPPSVKKDPVGVDISKIPAACSEIQRNW